MRQRPVGASRQVDHIESRVQQRPLHAALGQVAGLALDVAPSADERVQLSTRRNTLTFGDDPASLQTNTVSWSRGDEKGRVESVAARYIEETNLYRATALGTTHLPARLADLGGQRPTTRGPRRTRRASPWAMTYRHREAARRALRRRRRRACSSQSAPDADLAASTPCALSDAREIEGGVVGRYVGAAATASRRASWRATTWAADLRSSSRGLYRVVGSASARAP